MKIVKNQYLIIEEELRKNRQKSNFNLFAERVTNLTIIGGI